MQNVRGTQDFPPNRWAKIQKIIKIIRRRAIQLGAEEIDTPCLEYSKLLLEKYGEEAENKLIYRIKKYSDPSLDVKDVESKDEESKDGEDLGKGSNGICNEVALRYDMTVPFMRYLKSNKILNMVRFQVGKVFRKDIPYPQKGRFCEFMQADFDIVGAYSPMISEAQIIKLITMVLSDLDIKDYQIKINFRSNLETLINDSGIVGASSDTDLFKSICRTIDKLDKKSWAEIKTELLEKGINEESIEKLFYYLRDDPSYPRNPFSIKQWNMLKTYLEAFGSDKKIVFDPKLARGLDYYTGIIYEVVLVQDENKSDLSPIPSLDTKFKLGTIIAGGRYDRMVGMKRKGKIEFVPAIGVSFGINRIELCLGEEFTSSGGFRVLVVSQADCFQMKLKIINDLLNAGINVKFFDTGITPKKNVNQINWGIKNGYSYIIIVGENGNDLVKLKRNDNSVDQLVPPDQILDKILI